MSCSFLLWLNCHELGFNTPPPLPPRAQTFGKIMQTQPFRPHSDICVFRVLLVGALAKAVKTL